MQKTKRHTRGIRARSYGSFVLFAILILALLFVFQILLFEPYYSQYKMHSIRQIVNQLGHDPDDNFSSQSQVTVNNDGCSVIIDAQGGGHSVDAIGVSCLIYTNSGINTDYVEQLRSSETGDLSLQVTVGENEPKMLIYGKTFQNEEGNPYYVLFNTPMQPLRSTIEIIRRQYIVIALVVLAISLLISYFFSSRLSRPIIQMQKEAQKMSEGKYEKVHFQTDTSFRELNDLSEKLNNASNELGKVNELRRDLVANVSHDIRTPLTMIQAYAEMIRDITGDDPSMRQQNLNIILQETQYMSKLVNDMAEMTQMQSGQLKLNLSNFDLGGVIDSTIDKFNTISRSENLTIQQEVEPELIAYGDKFRITEVIYNFLGNAVKHYGDDHLILVRAFMRNKKTIRVEVIDHGPGIDPEALSHIWERYYKTDKKYQRAQRGTGLGLAICKAILDAHNAVYGVNSELGKGSTFYFEIPTGSMETGA